jgi:mRNA interferase RelE/StbE
MVIAFSRSAWRRWRKLPQDVQARLKQKLLRCSADPLKYAVKLSDPRIGQYRFRIGDYRIIFDLADDTLYVLEVGHRREIYR